MRPPKDLEDYSQCVRRDGELRVFCVECSRWRLVNVLAQRPKTLVVVSQGGESWEIDPPPLVGVAYVCSGCEADVGYLLTEHHRAVLAAKTGVTLPEPTNNAR